MYKTKLQIWAEDIALQKGFSVDKLIYQGEYYAAGHTGDIILSGTYNNKPAVLKAYDDPRLSDEPISLKNFIKDRSRNKSKRI